jgi:hypothetical protein
MFKVYTLEVQSRTYLRKSNLNDLKLKLNEIHLLLLLTNTSLNILVSHYPLSSGNFPSSNKYQV